MTTTNDTLALHHADGLYTLA